MIINPNIQILEAATERLRTLTEEMVFVGGCATGLLLTDPEILGFGNRWFTLAYEASEWTTLPSGKRIRLLPAPYFLATKLEAFESRGESDYLMSRDMEDIITVLDGRSEIVSEIQEAGKELKDYLTERFSILLNERDFLDALPGLLMPDAASQARSTLIIDRLKAIAGFRSFKGGAISPDHS